MTEKGDRAPVVRPASSTKGMWEEALPETVEIGGWKDLHDFENTMLTKDNPSSGEMGVQTNADPEDCTRSLGFREIRPPRSSDHDDVVHDDFRCFSPDITHRVQKVQMFDSTRDSGEMGTCLAHNRDNIRLTFSELHGPRNQSLERQRWNDW